MITNNHLSVCLMPELRLEQALKEAGIEDPASVERLPQCSDCLFVQYRPIARGQRPDAQRQTDCQIRIFGIEHPESAGIVEQVGVFIGHRFADDARGGL